MKKLFTLFAIIMMASSMAFASGKINFHLTGCTSDASNPTSYTEDDESGIELYFTPEEGYTLDDWEVTVKHGSTIIPNNNWTSPIGYSYPEASIGYLYIIWFDEITEDFDVTIVCKKDAPAEPTDLATLTAEVINNGTAVQVTSSDPDMHWKYNFMTYNAEDDPTRFVTIIDEEIRGVNDIFEDMAWTMYSSDAIVGSQTINVPEWYEEGDELSFYAFGFANKGDGTVKRATNVVFIPHFVYNATPTALENIATDAKSSKTSKLIKNGKLVIIKDGKKYNAAGQEM